MFDGGEDVLRRQRLEVLAGMMVVEPSERAPGTQENAFAGLRLKSPDPAQIVREGARSGVSGSSTTPGTEQRTAPGLPAVRVSAPKMRQRAENL
jgi:hypothetical protein